MTTNLFADVRRFALIAGSPTYQQDKALASTLFRRLIQEEVVEEFLPAYDKWAASPSLDNLVEVVDGAIDSIYVLCFFLNQMGMDGNRLWEIVHKANLAKFPGNVPMLDGGGKVVKPPGWVGPEAALLDELVEWNSAQRGESYPTNLVSNDPSDIDPRFPNLPD